jgi:hypothetical protein
VSPCPAQVAQSFSGYSHVLVPNRHSCLDSSENCIAQTSMGNNKLVMGYGFVRCSPCWGCVVTCSVGAQGIYCRVARCSCIYKRVSAILQVKLPALVNLCSGDTSMLRCSPWAEENRQRVADQKIKHASSQSMWKNMDRHIKNQRSPAAQQAEEPMK